MNQEASSVRAGLTDKTIAIIGAGKMGELFVTALLRSGGLGSHQIRATVRHHNHAVDLTARLGVSVGTNNADAVRGADIILICVKAQYVVEVLTEIRPAILPHAVVISIATSVTTQALEAALSGPIAVIRAMPNTACRIGQGMTALCRGHFATSEALADASSFFALMGKNVEVDEHLMDAVTGLSASGPAFIYMILEALAEGGVRIGMPRELATLLAAQATLGAAAMVLETGSHPAVLKNEVTTPGGCTVEGLLELEDGKIRATLIRAVAVTADKAGKAVPQRSSSSSSKAARLASS